MNIVRVEKLPQPNNVQHVYCTMSLGAFLVFLVSTIMHFSSLVS